MAINAIAGVGTLFQRYSGSAWVTMAEVNSIEGPVEDKDVIDVTSLETEGGYVEFITGFINGGTLTLNMNFTRSTYELMKSDFEIDIVRNYRIVLPDDEGTTLSFEGLVTEIPITMEAENQLTADVTIQVSGEVTLAVAEESSAVSESSEVGFTPDSLANMIREYYSDIGVTVTGSGVSQMADGSVNADHAVQTDDASRPPLVPNEINGLPAIVADGVADFLSFTSTGASLFSFSLFIVAAPTAYVNKTILGYSANGNYYILLLSNHTIRVTLAAQVYSFATGTLTGYHIYEIRKNGATLTVFIDGVPSASNPITTEALYPLTLNQFFKSSGSSYSVGSLAALVLYSEYKDDAESSLVVNFLKAKYAIA